MKLSFFIDWIANIVRTQQHDMGCANPDVVARLIWRDKEGCVVDVQYADIGSLQYATTYNVTIEMNSIRKEIQHEGH